MTSPTPPVSQPPAEASGITPILVAPESVPERQGVMSFMSEVSRNGDWVLPRYFRALAVMGKAVIDLTQVRIAPGTSEIDARAIMGEVKIIVPHNLRVECAGHPLLGEFSCKHRSDARAQPDAPLVRVIGVAVMGNVNVKVVDPNAPGWLARLRGRVFDESE